MRKTNNEKLQWRGIHLISGETFCPWLYSPFLNLYPLNFFYKDITERGWGYKYISLYHVLYRQDLPGLNADQEQTFTSSVLSSNSTCTKAFAFWPVPHKGKLKIFPCTKKKNRQGNIEGREKAIFIEKFHAVLGRYSFIPHLILHSVLTVSNSTKIHTIWF